MKYLSILFVSLVLPLGAQAGGQIDCGTWDGNHYPNEYSLSMSKDFSVVDGEWSFSSESDKMSPAKYVAWTDESKGKVASFHVAKIVDGNVTEYIFDGRVTLDGGQSKLKIYEYSMGSSRPNLASRTKDCIASLVD